MENTCNRHAREYSYTMSPITVKYNTILHNNYNTNYSPYSYHISSFLKCKVQGNNEQEVFVDCLKCDSYQFHSDIRWNFPCEEALEYL